MQLVRNIYAIALTAIGIVTVVLVGWILRVYYTTAPSLNTLVFQVRERPIAIRPSARVYDLSRNSAARIAKSVEPVFDRTKTVGRVPVSLILHSLRLCGPGTTIAEDSRWNTGEPVAAPLTKKEMVSILTEHERFESESMILGGMLLRGSDYGVESVIVSDGSYGSNEAFGHFGQLTQVMGEIGVASTRRVLLSDGASATIADVVRNDGANLSWGIELEWATSGLALYADCASWTNRFGNLISFDWIAERLIQQAPGSGACDGTHAPYAMSMLLRADEVNRHLLTHDVRVRLSARLAEYADALTYIQTAKGCWRWDWASALRGGIVPQRPRRYIDDIVATMVVTGHHLEWMAYAPLDCRPPNHVITAAADFLIESWPIYEQLLTSDWHLYNPLSHAAHGVFLHARPAPESH